jgi:hypothetical protein
MHRAASANLPILPCRHSAGIVDQVRPARELLEGMDRLHPDVLQGHGINPPDYHGALVFRSAIEQIRGSYIARAMSPRQQHVAGVLGRLRASRRIVEFQYTGGARRCDFAVTVSNEPRWQAAIEVKGGEGNSITISQRPLWADEFLLWCHLDGAIVNQPHEGAGSVIFSRVASELTRRQKRLDAVLFKDALCGTSTRPCPKYEDSVRANETLAPDVFLLPRRPPNVEDEPSPPIHDRQSVRLPYLILEEFGLATPGAQARHIWEVSIRLLRDQAGERFP